MLQDTQRAAKKIGAVGCYYLSLFQLSENAGAAPADPLRMFRAFEARKWIDAECFMLDPAAIMGYLTSRKWWVKKAGSGHELPLDYALKPDEYEILRFERPLLPGEPKTAETAHFVVGTGTGPLDKTRILWDSMPGTRAVDVGALVSRRIFGKV
jgi:hypothetical protein